ncbi:MAG: hypothetical protein KC416_17095 [Myxococcales bacterium]|nr:hypothetical protein [Myxococcales bacterium]
MIDDERREPESAEPAVLWIHPGHSANCSSVGSVVDFVFLAGVFGAAAVAAVTTFLLREGGETKGPTGSTDGEEPRDGAGDGTQGEGTDHGAG